MTMQSWHNVFVSSGAGCTLCPMIRKRVLKLTGLAVLVLAAVVACQSVRNGGVRSLDEAPRGALRIASLNVHYIDMRAKTGRWSLPGWEARKASMDRAFKAIDADLFAFQEMESFAGGNDDSVNVARAYLLAENPDYAAAAIGEWRKYPSTQPIFYRPDRLGVLEQGWFFFSETPDQIYSRTFDGSYPAFASWVRFKDLHTEATFRVVNVHTDYSSRENRRRSVDLIAQRIRPWIAAGETVFLAGDLNARLGSGLHRVLEGAGLRFVPVEGATYHLDLGLNLFGAIDHIGYSGAARPSGAPAVVREKFGTVRASDHYPVVADFDLH